MKIAMLGHKRIPSCEGGVEVVVEEIASRMVAYGHSVTCYNRSGHHVSGSQYDCSMKTEYKGIKICSVFTLDRRGLAAATSSAVASIKAAIGNYDIVHIHAEGPAFMCWLPKLFGKKVVVTIHGLDHQRSKWGKIASMYIMMGERNAVKYADKIIVLSENVKNYFRDTYNRETIYIPNGVNKVNNIPPDNIITKWNLCKDEYILYLGRIVPEKGIHYLIEAYKNIKCNKKLVIAGGTSDTKEYWNKLIEMAKIDKRIVFTDFVQGNVKKELYSNAYLYVLPSDLEGMPLSLLEAMSYGNCCLISDIPECVSVVEENAIKFKKSNIDDLKEKLDILCSNSELVNEYKSISEVYITQKYNWDDVVHKTLNCYK